MKNSLLIALASLILSGCTGHRSTQDDALAEIDEVVVEATNLYVGLEPSKSSVTYEVRLEGTAPRIHYFVRILDSVPELEMNLFRCGDDLRVLSVFPARPNLGKAEVTRDVDLKPVLLANYSPEFNGWLECAARKLIELYGFQTLTANIEAHLSAADGLFVSFLELKKTYFLELGCGDQLDCDAISNFMKEVSPDSNRIAPINKTTTRVLFKRSMGIERKKDQEQ